MIYITIGSFLISVLAIYITVRNEMNKKMSLQLLFQDKQLFEIIPDRIDLANPDPFYQADYRFIPFVVLINKSSLPISITEFSINDETYFNINSVETLLFPVSTNDTDSVSYSTKPLLKPVITLQPYEALSGYLIFVYKETLTNKRTTLSIKTSRKTKKVNLKVESTLKSSSPLDPQLQMKIEQLKEKFDT